MINNKRYLLAIALTAVLLCGCASAQARPVPTDDGCCTAPAQAEPRPAPTADVAPAGQTGVAARPTLPEPCDLLTKADLARVLPDPFGQGEAGELASNEGAAFALRNCAFHNGDKQVVLTLIPASSPYQEQKELAAFAHALQAVAGLGDEAFWESDSHELWVVKGQFTVVLGFDFMDASVDVAKPLVQQALSRLK